MHAFGTSTMQKTLQNIYDTDKNYDASPGWQTIDRRNTIKTVGACARITGGTLYVFGGAPSFGSAPSQVSQLAPLLVTAAPFAESIGSSGPFSNAVNGAGAAQIGFMGCVRENSNLFMLGGDTGSAPSNAVQRVVI